MPDRNDELHEKTMEIYRILLKAYGERERLPGRDPMEQLIATMLSQRTTWQNEAKAFRQMWERFGSWEAIRDAPLDALTEAIAPSTFPEVKAPNIQKTLERIIHERGAANIDFLADLPVEEGLKWLLSLPGVGVKTATLVLLFSFGKPVMPVDTHVHRTSQRLGLIGAKVMHEAAHARLLALLPPEPLVLYNFHRTMLKHGQQICVWGTPRCERCPLTHLCDWYQSNRAAPP